jgi:cytosine/adenosine deaminase-related metal-dependent hydrolase
MKYFNAHCHLELGWLRGKLPQGVPFCDWLKLLVVEKRNVDRAVSAAAANAGIEELRRTGTVAIGDIVAMDTSVAGLALEHDMERVLFREMIRFEEDQGAAAVAEAITRQADTSEVPARLMHALSPHAPYSTTGTLLRTAAAEAFARGQWLCIHAAEMPEETEFMLHGKGPFATYLGEVVERTGWRIPHQSSIEWLDANGALGPGTLLAHCNEVTDSDIALIVERGARVVVCPGTHVFFRRGAFPLERLVRAGVKCYLGTDSLASNEALDMAREVRLAQELSPGLDAGLVESLASAERAAEFMAAPLFPSRPGVVAVDSEPSDGRRESR